MCHSEKERWNEDTIRLATGERFGHRHGGTMVASNNGGGNGGNGSDACPSACFLPTYARMWRRIGEAAAYDVINEGRVDCEGYCAGVHLCLRDKLDQ